MNQYAIIENNKVVNVVVADDSYAAKQGWILTAENVGISWAYINESFIDENTPSVNEKAKIKADIAILEATITPRRTREAILGIGGAWLEEQEAAIAALRVQL